MEKEGKEVSKDEYERGSAWKNKEEEEGKYIMCERIRKSWSSEKIWNWKEDDNAEEKERCLKMKKDVDGL